MSDVTLKLTVPREKEEETVIEGDIPPATQGSFSLSTGHTPSRGDGSSCLTAGSTQSPQGRLGTSRGICPLLQERLFLGGFYNLPLTSGRVAQVEVRASPLHPHCYVHTFYVTPLTACSCLSP